jgi:membrane-bound metal-dependent hydrolase YbcI (DUF457 family)
MVRENIGMNWVFYALLGAVILHVVEEYAFPGGFPAFMKKMARPFAPYVTTGFAIAINGLFLLLCLAAALITRDAMVFRLSIAALCGINGLTHLAGYAMPTLDWLSTNPARSMLRFAGIADYLPGVFHGSICS